MLPLGAARRHMVPRQHLPRATSLFDAVHTRDHLWTGRVAELGRDATPGRNYVRARPSGGAGKVCLRASPDVGLAVVRRQTAKLWPTFERGLERSMVPRVTK